MAEKFRLQPLDKSDVDLVYSDEKKDAERGTVGHLRMDTGSSGKEFWTTWWPHNDNKLNKEPFRNDLDRVVDALREAGGPLHSLTDMQNFCRKFGESAALDSGRSFGFKLETDDHQYMLRLTPHRGEYSYLYCYDKAAQREHTEKQSVIGQLSAKAEKAVLTGSVQKKKQEMER